MVLKCQILVLIIIIAGLIFGNLILGKFLNNFLLIIFRHVENGTVAPYTDHGIIIFYIYLLKIYTRFW